MARLGDGQVVALADRCPHRSTRLSVGEVDDDDRQHLAFQDVVLAEDEPVVTNQVAPEIPLDPSVEV